MYSFRHFLKNPEYVKVFFKCIFNIKKQLFVLYMAYKVFGCFSI